MSSDSAPSRLQRLHAAVGDLLARWASPDLPPPTAEDVKTLRPYLFAVVIYRSEGEARATVAAEVRALKAAEEERLRGHPAVEIMNAMDALDRKAAERVTSAGTRAAAAEEAVLESAPDLGGALAERTGAAWLWLDARMRGL